MYCGKFNEYAITVFNYIKEQWIWIENNKINNTHKDACATYLKKIIPLRKIERSNGGEYMLNTTKKLINEEQIIKILKEIVINSYQQIKEEDVLLCLECCDVDLEIATANDLQFEEAIKANFELDEFGEIVDHDEYRHLMYELYDFFIELHKESGFFDFFPEGEYTVNGETRESDSDMISPKGRFYAPFEEALLKQP